MNAPQTKTASHARIAPSDLLEIAALDRDQLEGVLTLAAHMKAEPLAWREAQAGKMLACYFTKPSTRTRVSLEGAAWRLGMLPIMLGTAELQLGRGETIADTAKVLSGYTDAIAIRTFAQAEVEEFAAAASVPVINALTDEHHPCQALADLLTLRERFENDLQGVRLAYLGDGNNVAHSLLQGGALSGMSIVVCCPHGYEPATQIVAAAAQVARREGGHVSVTHDIEEAVYGADVVYTDVWVSMGEESERERRLEELTDYRVTPKLMQRASAEALFMHCLPAHRGQEVSEAVIDGSQSIVFDQAANRLPTEQALIHTLLEGGV